MVSPGMSPITKDPEMNELEPDKKFLEIWAHNFEKQKSYSLLKLSSEKLRGRIGWLFAGFGKRFSPKKYGNSLIEFRIIDHDFYT